MPDTRTELARVLHDAACRWGVECRDDPLTFHPFRGQTDAVLAWLESAGWRPPVDRFPGCHHERRPGSWGHDGECITCSVDPPARYDVAGDSPGTPLPDPAGWRAPAIGFTGGPSLEETSPDLIAGLRALFDEFGPQGVARTVAQLRDRAGWRAPLAADDAPVSGTPRYPPIVLPDSALNLDIPPAPWLDR